MELLLLPPNPHATHYTNNSLGIVCVIFFAYNLDINSGIFVRVIALAPIVPPGTKPIHK